MPMEIESLRISQLDSPERVELLEEIDKLRELGVGNEINLPQVRAWPSHSALEHLISGHNPPMLMIYSWRLWVISHLARAPSWKD